ncbi:hypothetical protein ABID21_004286 [Pseudorhizobium tarimense]|uniref:Uncharacterized protein n=1 Tax=Pseudorhizobium tarimense TaxID=1079109 RepID=A0ABV2HC87_9HYPH
MIMQDQSAVIAFLGASEAFGISEPVEIIRTHTS